MSGEAPLFGLVLAGGASTRMQQDKAAIEYHGQSQLHWTFHLLSHVCAATFVSVRPDQREEPTRAGLPQIVDRLRGIGPLAGITAALQAHPKAAWLVVACDLPFLNEHTLRYLISHRDAYKLATAFRSSHDDLPEPLCAIWEPAAREPVLAFVAAGKQCPRKFLINADTLLLDLPDARALDNVNTADEFKATVATLGSSTAHNAAAIYNDSATALLGKNSVATSTQSGATALPGESSGTTLTQSGATALLGESSGTALTQSGATALLGKSSGTALTQSGATALLGESSGTALTQSGATTLLGESGVATPTQSGTQATPPASGSGPAQSTANINAAAHDSKGRSTGATTRTLRVQYYAILREQAGRSEETLDTTAATPAELYDELRKRHPFQLAAAQLKVALNSDFSDWHTPLKHGDTVVFIPPVAGG